MSVKNPELSEMTLNLMKSNPEENAEVFEQLEQEELKRLAPYEKFLNVFYVEIDSKYAKMKDYSDAAKEQNTDKPKINNLITKLAALKDIKRKIKKATEMSMPYNAAKKLHRNDLCRCGSGKKYKNCCLRKDEEEEIAAL